MRPSMRKWPKASRDTSIESDAERGLPLAAVGFTASPLLRMRFHLLGIARNDHSGDKAAAAKVRTERMDAKSGTTKMSRI